MWTVGGTLYGAFTGVSWPRSCLLPAQLPSDSTAVVHRRFSRQPHVCQLSQDGHDVSLLRQLVRSFCPVSKFVISVVPFLDDW